MLLPGARGTPPGLTAELGAGDALVWPAGAPSTGVAAIMTWRAQSFCIADSTFPQVELVWLACHWQAQGSEGAHAWAPWILR